MQDEQSRVRLLQASQSTGLAHQAGECERQGNWSVAEQLWALAQCEATSRAQSVWCEHRREYCYQRHRRELAGSRKKCGQSV
jgi:hypothetical protein